MSINLTLSKKEERRAKEWRLNKCGSINFNDLFYEFKIQYSKTFERDWNNLSIEERNRIDNGIKIGYYEWRIKNGK